MTADKKGVKSAKSLFSNYQLSDKGGYVTQEFQDYGYRLAIELGDLKHKSLYIKMAKTVKRSVLERALSFIRDANARSKAKLFMWKVKEIRREDKLRGDGKIGERENRKTNHSLSNKPDN